MKRTRRSKRQWQQLITELEVSGMSDSAMAERLGCNPSTVAHWRQVLRRPATPRKIRPAFVEVKPAPIATTSDAAALRVEGPMGFSAVFGDLPPPAYLAAIITALRQQAC